MLVPGRRLASASQRKAAPASLATFLAYAAMRWVCPAGRARWTLFPPRRGFDSFGGRCTKTAGRFLIGRSSHRSESPGRFTLRYRRRAMVCTTFPQPPDDEDPESLASLIVALVPIAIAALALSFFR